MREQTPDIHRERYAWLAAAIPVRREWCKAIAESDRVERMFAMAGTSDFEHEAQAGYAARRGLKTLEVMEAERDALRESVGGEEPLGAEPAGEGARGDDAWVRDAAERTRAYCAKCAEPDLGRLALRTLDALEQEILAVEAANRSWSAMDDEERSGDPRTPRRPGRVEVDEAMQRAMVVAPGLIFRDPDDAALRDRLVVEGLERAWMPAAPGPALSDARLPAPDWDPDPVAVDLVTGQEPVISTLIAAIEAKADDLHQMLPGLFKLLAVQRGTPSIRRCYLVAAARPGCWEQAECGELFCVDRFAEWDSAEMFERWQRSWSDLLAGGSPRPVRVPARVATQYIGGGTVLAFQDEGYELRCVAVEPVPDAGWLEFDGDWPSRAASHGTDAVDESGPPRLSQPWIESVLPTLTNAQAHEVVAELRARGASHGDLVRDVIPHLPKLAAALRQGDPGGPVSAEDETFERIATAGYGPSANPLLDAAEDHAFAVGTTFDHAVLFITRDGGLGMTHILRPELEVAGVTDTLREKESDRFAVVTTRFGAPGEVHLLFGCPTGRTDALATTVHEENGTRVRSPWRECGPGPARDFIDAVEAEILGGAG